MTRYIHFKYIIKYLMFRTYKTQFFYANKNLVIFKCFNLMADAADKGLPKHDTFIHRCQ